MPDSYRKPTITAELAQRLVTSALAQAQERGGAFAVAVVDDSGDLKAFLRMDGAGIMSIQAAADKAYTAVSNGVPSHALYDAIKDDPPMLIGATTGVDRFLILGGGYPVKVDGAVVGGFGVAGGHHHDDMALAEAVLKELGLDG